MPNRHVSRSFWETVAKAGRIAASDEEFVRQVTREPFAPGDRVRHGFLGFEDTMERLDAVEGLSGAYVAWDAGYEVVDHEPGEPIWYPNMALEAHNLARRVAPGPVSHGERVMGARESLSAQACQTARSDIEAAARAGEITATERLRRHQRIDAVELDRIEARAGR